LAHTSVRIGIGRFTTEEEVDEAIHLTKQVFIIKRSFSLFLFSIACNKIKRNVPTLGNGSRGDRFINYSMDTR